MQKTKIEVMLDKMQLVLEEADAELDEMEQRLLARYTNQLAQMLNGEPAAGAPTKDEGSTKTGQTKQPAEPEPKPKPEPSPNTTASEASQKAAEPEQPTEAKETPDKKESTRPKVNPLEEEDTTKEQQDGMDFSFVDEPDKEEEEPATSATKEEKSTSEQEKQHEEIYKNLEEIRKNRAAQQHLVAEDDDDEDDEEEEGKAPMPDNDTEPSVNDRFRQEEADLVDHLKAKPIKSLQREIDLNDKFWFINQLFDGDATTFNNLLKELDGLYNFEEAKAKIQKVGKDQYDWSDNDRAVNKFYQVVRRRYL